MVISVTSTLALTMLRQALSALLAWSEPAEVAAETLRTLDSEMHYREVVSEVGLLAIALLAVNLALADGVWKTLHCARAMRRAQRNVAEPPGRIR